MPDLVIGPMLRYVDATAATIFVETDAACTVEVLGRAESTFCIGGHHYAIVAVEALEPDTATPYDVRLDGRLVWPDPAETRPPGRIRTLPAEGPRRIVAGSCRVDRPHEPPWTLTADQDPRGVGHDALRALALRLLRAPDDEWPDLLLFVGDQVYGDEGLSPRIERRVRERTDRTHPDAPRDEVGDFEEYTWLYRDSWRDPDTRWLLSTVPSAMIFDDHDVRDDWNISEAWRSEIRRQPWWSARIHGALMSYWIYQHLGNLSPAELARNELLAALRGTGDGETLLRNAMRDADTEIDGRKPFHWSYSRELGHTRLVVVDSRSGRVLEGEHRSMLDDEEFRWVEDEFAGDIDHLVVVTSLPLMLTPALHYLEAANEALCGGIRGRVVARWSEKIRQAEDLEHWAAFYASFERAMRALLATARGERGRVPTDILVVSGDVHYSYIAAVEDPSLRCRLLQITTSPIRNALPKRIRRLARAANRSDVTRAARFVARLLGRVPDPPAPWNVTDGPTFGNTLLTLDMTPRGAHVLVETVRNEAPILEERMAREPS